MGLEQFIGQKHAINCLKVATESANKTNRPCRHCLLYGEADSGKKFMGTLIAEEMDSEYVLLDCLISKRESSVLEALLLLDYRDVLILDNIDFASSRVVAQVCNAAENWEVTKTNKQIPIFPFTLVGAASGRDRTNSKLKERVDLEIELGIYQKEELVELMTIFTESGIQKGLVDHGAIERISEISGGSMHKGKKVTGLAFDYCVANERERMTRESVDEARKIFKF